MRLELCFSGSTSQRPSRLWPNSRVDVSIMSDTFATGMLPSYWFIGLLNRASLSVPEFEAPWQWGLKWYTWGVSSSTNERFCSKGCFKGNFTHFSWQMVSEYTTCSWIAIPLTEATQVVVRSDSLPWGFSRIYARMDQGYIRAMAAFSKHRWKFWNLPLTLYIPA